MYELFPSILNVVQITQHKQSSRGELDLYVDRGHLKL